MPMPLLVAAAAMPETWVPWVSDGCATPSGPFQSPLPQDGLQPMKVAPDTSLPCRSAWPRSTPVSTTAMTVPAPVLVAHACSACTCWGPYCLAYSGSLGAAARAGDAVSATADRAAAATAAGRARRMTLLGVRVRQVTLSNEPECSRSRRGSRSAARWAARGQPAQEPQTDRRGASSLVSGVSGSERGARAVVGGGLVGGCRHAFETRGGPSAVRRCSLASCGVATIPAGVRLARTLGP